MGDKKSVEANMTSCAKPVRFSRRFVGVAEGFGTEDLSWLSGVLDLRSLLSQRHKPLEGLQMSWS